jgi:predicted RNA-binding protein associated with RNAse of E/G family
VTDIGEGYDITRDLQFIYTRLPDDVVRYRHWKVFQDSEMLVSVFYEDSLTRPMVAAGRTIAERSLFGISYNFWDKWYNVISIYDDDLQFQGYYSDILTPIEKSWNVITATDLFLDFFMFPDGTWTRKDEDEFEDAVANGLMDEGIERTARQTIEEIEAKAQAGEWPPECVNRIPSDPQSVLMSVRNLELP